MNKPIVLKQLPMTCKCQPQDAGCDDCVHMRCDFCAEIGTRMAQTFSFSISKDNKIIHAASSMVYHQCDKPFCERSRNHYFDIGKEMAKEGA